MEKERRNREKEKKQGRQNFQRTLETRLSATRIKNNTASMDKRLYNLFFSCPQKLIFWKKLTLFHSKQVAQFCWWMILDWLRIHHICQRQEGVIIWGWQVGQGQCVVTLLGVCAWATDTAVQNLWKQKGMCATDATNLCPLGGRTPAW